MRKKMGMQPTHHHFACPVCGSAIGSDRMFMNMAVCECGWTSSLRSHQIESRRDFGISVTLVAIAAVMILGVLHFIQWDRYSLDVLVIKGKELTGLARLSDLDQKAKICRDRLQLDCVSETLERLHRYRPGDLKYTAELAQIQVKLGKWNDAQITFSEYVNAGGNDYKLLYEYAKVLSEVGQIDLASQYFDQVLKMKPEVLQIQVTRSYVNMLMTHSRYVQARRIIERFRETGESSAYFLDDEMREIQRKTAASRS